MIREIIHDNTKLYATRIYTAQPLKSSQEITHSLAFVNSTCKAVAMDIVEAQELFGARPARVGGTEPLRMSLRCPVLSMLRTEFQRTPFVEGKNGTVRWSLMIKLKNAVFFSQTLGLGTLSTSLFAGTRAPRVLEVFESTHY